MSKSSNTAALVSAGGPDDTSPGCADSLKARKAPQFAQNLALAEVMQQAAAKQFCESPKDITAQAVTIADGKFVQRVAQKCRGIGGQRHIDSCALFARFATVSTLSSAVAPEHGNVNRLIRSGSHPKLDEPEAPTLDATGLRHVLRAVGLGVPKSTSVRPMLAEFGEVVGCQQRMTYAQFEMLRAVLKARGDVAAVEKVQRAWRTWSARSTRHRTLFARFATVSTLSSAVAPEHGSVNRLIRSGSHPKLDELETPTLDATGLRHMLRAVGLGVPKSKSVRPMLAEFGEVVGCQQRMTYAQFQTLRATLNGCVNCDDCGEVAAAAKVQRAWRMWRTRRAWHRALFARFATVSTLSSAVAPEHGNVNRFIRSGSHPKLDELEAPTLDSTGLRHMLGAVGLGVPNSTSVRPMLDEFGEVVGCQPRLTYAQFQTLRAALNACGDVEAVAKVQRAWRMWRTRRTWHRALFVRFATVSTLSSAIAPEHGNVNRFFRSGSHPTLDEPEELTLDATGLRHMLRGVGLGVPNTTSVRPMLAEFGEVVGCQQRLTYAQFQTLRNALDSCGGDVAAVVKTRAAEKATTACEQRAESVCSWKLHHDSDMAAALAAARVPESRGCGFWWC